MKYSDEKEFARLLHILEVAANNANEFFKEKMKENTPGPDYYNPPTVQSAGAWLNRLENSTYTMTEIFEGIVTKHIASREVDGYLKEALYHANMFEDYPTEPEHFDTTARVAVVEFMTNIIEYAGVWETAKLMYEGGSPELLPGLLGKFAYRRRVGSREANWFEHYSWVVEAVEHEVQLLKGSGPRIGMRDDGTLYWFVF